MWEYVGLIFVVLLWKASRKKKGEWVEEPWSLSKAKAIQGISAIGIILHHGSQRLINFNVDVGGLKAFENFGVLFVGIFFFFSGYGLIKSYESKPDYFKHFFRNRFSTLLIPYLLCNFIYYIVVVAFGARYSFKETILTLIGYHPINDQIWYVIVIAIFYLVFYLLFRFIKNRTVPMIGMFLFIAGYIAYCMTREYAGGWFQGEWWYNTALLFGVGLLFGTCEEHIMKFLKKAYVILLPLSTLATIGFYFLDVHCLTTYSYWSDSIKDKLICFGVQTVMVLCFVMTILLIMMKVKFENVALSFLGKRSLEIYLIQALFFVYLCSDQTIQITNKDLYLGAVIICTVIAAFLIHCVDGWLVQAIRKGKNGNK